MSKYIYNFEEVVELNSHCTLNKKDYYLNNSTNRSKLNKINYVLLDNVLFDDEGFTMRDDFDLQIKNLNKLKQDVI